MKVKFSFDTAGVERRGYGLEAVRLTVKTLLIGTLRTKLGACGEYLETVRGVGYRIKGKV